MAAFMRTKRGFTRVADTPRCRVHSGPHLNSGETCAEGNCGSLTARGAVSKAESETLKVSSKGQFDKLRH